MTEQAQSGKDSRVEERDSTTYPAPWTDKPPLKWVLKNIGNAFGAAVLIGAAIGVAFLSLRAVADWTRWQTDTHGSLLDGVWAGGALTLGRENAVNGTD